MTHSQPPSNVGRHFSTPGNLTRRAVSGAAWTLPTSVGTRIVGLVGTLMIARYVMPADYGDYAAAYVVAQSAAALTTFGVGTYLVATPNLSRAETFHATCWFLASGLLAGLAALAAIEPLANWFGAPASAQFVPLVLAGAALDRITYIPERILVRQLRFRWLSIARGTGELIFTIVAVTLAARGHGAMSLVWAGLVRSGLKLALIVPAVDRREWLEPNRLHVRTMRQIVSYGLNVSAASTASFAMRRWDNLLISRYFGPAVLGSYNYAYNLADTPAVAVGEQISDVVAASIPHVKPGERVHALVRALGLLALIMFPLSFGLGVVAPTVVQVFFPERWAGVGTMLTALAVLSCARPLADVVLSYLYASHRPASVAALEWASVVTIVASIATVGRIGVTSACLSVGAAFVIRTVLSVWVISRFDKVPLAGFFRPMVKPLAASVLMAVAVVWVRTVIGSSPAAARLAIEVGTGAIVYVACVLTIARDTAREVWTLLRTIRPSARQQGGTLLNEDAAVVQ